MDFFCNKSSHLYLDTLSSYHHRLGICSGNLLLPTILTLRIIFDKEFDVKATNPTCFAHMHNCNHNKLKRKTTVKSRKWNFELPLRVLRGIVLLFFFFFVCAS